MCPNLIYPSWRICNIRNSSTTSLWMCKFWPASFPFWWMRSATSATVSLLRSRKCARPFRCSLKFANHRTIFTSKNSSQLFWRTLPNTTGQKATLSLWKSVLDSFFRRPPRDFRRNKSEWVSIWHRQLSPNSWKYSWTNTFLMPIRWLSSKKRAQGSSIWSRMTKLTSCKCFTRSFLAANLVLRWCGNIWGTMLRKRAQN